jgi:imidazolonepropionase-like amidohydrolase
MCLHDHTAIPPPTGPISRRNILSGAAALAGVTAIAFAGTPAAAASAARSESASDYSRRPVGPKALIIAGGNIVDPASGNVLEDGVVVLDEGSISAVGSRDQVREAIRSVAGRAQTISADGRWIVPGLVDVHVHANAVADAKAVLHAGATTVRSGSTSFYQDVALAAIPKWAPGLGPRMQPAGLFVSPELGDSILADPELAPLARLADGVTDPRDLAHLTRVNLKRGAKAIKTRANPRAGIAEQDPLELVYDREQLSAIVSAARKTGVLCHAYSEEGIDGAVRAGVHSIEHGVFLGEATMEEMARRGTFFTPTLAGVMAMSESPDPVLSTRGREYSPILQQAIREAHERGVTVVAGTDSFGTDVVPIGTEVRRLVAAGLSPLEGLRAATTHAAKLLGWSSRVGRLARGAAADVLVVDANPLEDGSALEQVRTVVAQGLVVRNGD